MDSGDWTHGGKGRLVDAEWGRRRGLGETPGYAGGLHEVRWEMEMGGLA